MTVSGLSLRSSGSYLCMAYGGMSIVCGLVRYIVGNSGINVCSWIVFVS